MAPKLTVRLTPDLASWLTQAAARIGVSQDDLVRGLLERARAAEENRTFMRLAGTVRGPRDLSSRKGLSRQ